jgi:peptidoglycan/LPS O-acetylase OafA/YrhL
MHGSFTAGFVGVDLFFVLSGFLVCQVLLGAGADDASGPPRLRDFYARRTRRLLPAALLAAVGSVVMTAGILGQEVRVPMVDSARASVLYANNWHRIVTADELREGGLVALWTEQFDAFNHWWSLSIEEQYYAVFPLLVGAVALLVRRRVSWWLAGVLATGCAASIVAQTLPDHDPVRAYYGTDTRAYQLLAGATLAVVLRLVPRLSPGGRVGTIARQTVGVASVVALLTTAMRGWGDMSVSAEGLVATAAAVGIVWALDDARPRWVTGAFALGPVRYVGEISYGMYLWHWPVQIILRVSTTLAPTEVFVVSAVASAALAALSHGLVEMPIRRSRLLDKVPVPTVAVGLAASVAVAVWVVAPILRWEASDKLRYRTLVTTTTTVPVPLPGEPGGTVLLEGRDLVGMGQGDADVVEALEEPVPGR